MAVVDGLSVWSPAPMSSPPGPDVVAAGRTAGLVTSQANVSSETESPERLWRRISRAGARVISSELMQETKQKSGRRRRRRCVQERGKEERREGERQGGEGESREGGREISYCFVRGLSVLHGSLTLTRESRRHSLASALAIAKL